MELDDENLLLDLESNAKDSLEHAVEHFLEAQKTKDISNLKFTILHTFHAIELFLKARLAKADFSLIFEKPEQATLTDGKTVSFETLLGRLESDGVKLDDKNKGDIRYLKKIRNRIEHHKVQFSEDSAEEYLARGYRFLDSFLQTQLKTTLEDILPANIYKALSLVIHSYEERLEKAQEKAWADVPYDKDGIGYELVECPECEEDTLAAGPSEEGSKQCTFCEANAYLVSCSRCGEVLAKSRKPSSEDDWFRVCSACERRLMSE